MQLVDKDPVLDLKESIFTCLVFYSMRLCISDWDTLEEESYFLSENTLRILLVFSNSRKAFLTSGEYVFYLPSSMTLTLTEWMPILSRKL
jgi:hypothetical protein